jgi:NDP-sugar pyrophosphorylase family protein
MKAMILAAGFGTRLWPLTVGRTKPALPFLNRPLIAYTIEYLKRHGVEDLIINLHHEPDSVREQIGDGSDYGVRIDHQRQDYHRHRPRRGRRGSSRSSGSSHVGSPP